MENPLPVELPLEVRGKAKEEVCWSVNLETLVELHLTKNVIVGNMCPKKLRVALNGEIVVDTEDFCEPNEQINAETAKYSLGAGQATICVADSAYFSLLINSRSTACGDGIQSPHEACDDSNPNNRDGCSDTCQVEEGFTCAEGNCRQLNVCGDGIPEGDEICDDGNDQAGDGCFQCSGEEFGYCIESYRQCFADDHGALDQPTDLGVRILNHSGGFSRTFSKTVKMRLVEEDQDCVALETTEEAKMNVSMMRNDVYGIYCPGNYSMNLYSMDNLNQPFINGEPIAETRHSLGVCEELKDTVVPPGKYIICLSHDEEDTRAPMGEYSLKIRATEAN